MVKVGKGGSLDWEVDALMEALAEHVGALLFIYILPATLGGKCNLVARWAHRKPAVFTLVRLSSSAAAGEWNGTTTAVKVLEHQEAEGGGQLLEALLSAQISHPNVVRAGIRPLPARVQGRGTAAVGGRDHWDEAGKGEEEGHLWV